MKNKMIFINKALIFMRQIQIKIFCVNDLIIRLNLYIEIK